MKSLFKCHLVNCIQFVEIAKISSNNTLHRCSSLYIETMYRVAQVSIFLVMHKMDSDEVDQRKVLLG